MKPPVIVSYRTFRMDHGGRERERETAKAAAPLTRHSPRQLERQGPFHEAVHPQRRLGVEGAVHVDVLQMPLHVAHGRGGPRLVVPGAATWGGDAVEARTELPERDP